MPQTHKDRSQHQKALAAACRVANIPMPDFIGVHGRQFGEMWQCRYVVFWLLYWKAHLGIRDLAIVTQRSRPTISRILKMMRHPMEEEAGPVFVACGKLAAAMKDEQVEPMTLKDVQAAVRALRVPVTPSRPVAPAPTSGSPTHATPVPDTSS